MISDDGKERMVHEYGALHPQGEPSSQSAYEHQNGSSGPWPWLERIFVVRNGDDNSTASSTTAIGRVNPASEMDSVTVAATAQNMDACSKGVLHSASAFLGPALIHAASLTACEQNQQFLNGECQLSERDASDLQLWGVLRPSSILTVSSMISTIAAALFLPVLGAIIDRTPHRKDVGILTAYGLVGINLLQIFVTTNNWPIFAVTYTINDFLNVLHHAIVLAYLQNLTPNVQQLTRYSSSFAMVQFVGMIGYMLFMVVFSRISKADELFANSVAHMVSGSFGLIVLVYAWRYLFVHTPPRHGDELDMGSYSLCRNSWMGLFDTIRRISQDYTALKWLLFTLLWSPSLGSGSYFSIFSTLHKSLMQMTSAQIGIVNLVTLLSTVVGAKLASYLAQRINPLKSFQLCLLCLIINTACTAWFVTGPDQLYLYMMFQCILGMSFGWLMPTERVLFCTLSPLGQEAELMGLVISVHTAAAWVPPFLFSAMNEAGYSLLWHWPRKMCY